MPSIKRKKIGSIRKTTGAYGDEQDEEDKNLSEDEFFSRSEGEDSEGMSKTIGKVYMFCRHTKYTAVKEAGKTFCEFHLTRKIKSDWDIAWFDAPVNV